MRQKNWPVAKIPLVKVGTFTLNRNAKNYFEEIEELAFAPSDLVPGIEPSEDRLLQGRLFSYFDTQRYRLGTNFQKIPVNAPKNSPANNYNQNGAADNAVVTSDVNYQPSVEAKTLVDDNTFKLAKTAYSNAAISQKKIEKTNDFAQAGELYRSYTKEMQDNLIANMAGDLGQVRNKEVQKKMITHFYLADREYGMRLAAALGFTQADFMKK